MSLPKNQNLIDVVLRQTDYTEEKTIEKLAEHKNNVLEVVREYMGIVKKQAEDTTKSANQQIYSEIRNLMDDASKAYSAKKAFEKRKEEYIKYMQEKAALEKAAEVEQAAAAEQAQESLQLEVKQTDEVPTA